MKTRHIIITLVCLLTVVNSEAQFLKKLMKKAENAAERTILNRTDKEVSEETDKTIDDITGDKSGNDNTDSPNSKQGTATVPSGTKFENPSLTKNTEAKRDWYTSDVKVTSFDKEKNSKMTSYFDAESIAMQSFWKDEITGAQKNSFIDSEGFFISYNEKEMRYTKTGLLSMPGMSMMAPSMMASAYKLPESAIFGGMSVMEELGLAIYPFMHVDFPFVIKPDHFRDEMNNNNYEESKESCRGRMECTKFSVMEAGYEGSYTLFDDQDRLVEINIEVKGDPFFGSGKGKIEYFYEDCVVKVPAATEKKMLGQDLLKMGMDPNKN